MRWFVTLAVCFSMTLAGCKPKLESGQAGRAYVESETGELIASDEAEAAAARPADVSEVPQGEDKWLTQFELIERSGEPITSEDLKGQPYVASFFYSSCPSICVQQNEKVKELQKKYQGKPVHFVCISCDPEVDRPEVLSKYAERFEADKDQWLFLTGELDYIRRVGSEIFQLPVNLRFHAEKFVLVGADGKIVGFYAWATPEQWRSLQHDLDELIAQVKTTDTTTEPKTERPPEPEKKADGPN